MTELFRVDGLRVQPATEQGATPGDEILSGFDLRVGAGEVHAIVGPEGPGKGALGNALMGSPLHEVTAGSIHFQGDDVTEWPTDERAKAGMFLAFQHPGGIDGVSTLQLLQQAVSTRTGVDLSAPELRLAATDWTARLGMDSSFVDRSLDEVSSGGERQGSEMIQMAILEPELAILDQADAVPDGDALRVISLGIQEMRVDRPSMGIVLIAGDQRLLEAIQPDHVHTIIDGRIVHSDDIAACRVPA